MSYIFTIDHPELQGSARVYPKGALATTRGLVPAQDLHLRSLSISESEGWVNIVMSASDGFVSGSSHITLNRATVVTMARAMGLITDDPIDGWEPDPGSSWPNTYERLVADTRAACTCACG